LTGSSVLNKSGRFRLFLFLLYGFISHLPTVLRKHFSAEPLARDVPLAVVSVSR